MELRGIMSQERAFQAEEIAYAKVLRQKEVWKIWGIKKGRYGWWVRREEKGRRYL